MKPYFPGVDPPICPIHIKEHQYTIPVEWLDISSVSGGNSKYTITKLRCACGEEIDR